MQCDVFRTMLNVTFGNDRTFTKRVCLKRKSNGIVSTEMLPYMCKLSHAFTKIGSQKCNSKKVFHRFYCAIPNSEKVTGFYCFSLCKETVLILFNSETNENVRTIKFEPSFPCQDKMMENNVQFGYSVLSIEMNFIQNLIIVEFEKFSQFQIVQFSRKNHLVRNYLTFKGEKLCQRRKSN